MSEVVVEVRGLEHTYMRGTPMEAPSLKGVDFDVRRGETVALLGHTGCGKSTLVQHLNGLLRPQKGRVRVLEYDLNDPKVDVKALRRRVALLFQNPEAQLFERYVGDDVAFGPRQLGLSREEVRARVREALEAVGLGFEAFKDRLTFTLSGGEKRRVALAGVLALRPEILVLDEPLAGLDPAGRRHLVELIRRLKSEWGLTLILVSHDLEDVVLLADRCFVMADGRVVLSGTPREIFSQPPARLAEFGLQPPAVTAAVHALAEAGLGVRRDCLTVDEAVSEIARALGMGGKPWTSSSCCAT